MTRSTERRRAHAASTSGCGRRASSRRARSPPTPWTGKVLVNGARVKPARALKLGDELQIRTPGAEYIVHVNSAFRKARPGRRGGASSSTKPRRANRRAQQAGCEHDRASRRLHQGPADQARATDHAQVARTSRCRPSAATQRVSGKLDANAPTSDRGTRVELQGEAKWTTDAKWWC